MGYLRQSPRISKPPTDRDRRSQARQSREESTPRLTPQKRRSPALSQGLRTEWSALLIRRKAAKLLTERYDAEETTHESQSPSKMRRRSPLVPHIRKSRRSSEPAVTEIPEPNPCSNIWRTDYYLFLNLIPIASANFTKNPLGVLTELTRVPAGPVRGLDQILSPTIAEFVPKGTPSDPSRKSKWADGWGPQPSVAASVTALVLRILNQLDMYACFLYTSTIGSPLTHRNYQFPLSLHPY
ncbi:hypothetical protein B0H13DRAFT_2051731 [Mycena leptocephala]|nr:hypothetical protein B0H13DRAFT_2051731 [Mycena leptocephala]